MKDYLFLSLRDLPYFRALIRAVEAGFYQGLDLPPPALDVGCGDGHFAGLAFARPIEVGVDSLHAPIREAARRSGYRLLVEADGGRLPFPDGYFASAFSNSVLEHIAQVDQVLAEIARTLRSGSPFYFSVPNPRYLSELCLSRVLGRRYADWFRRISRVQHADGSEVWRLRLEKAGFTLKRWWHYFSPQALRVLEWGHYFGLPSLITRWLTGRWILAPYRWNLALTGRLVRKYAQAQPHKQGTFTFYIACKT